MAKVPAPTGKGQPPTTSNTMGNLDAPALQPLVALNFKVPQAFHRDYKVTAAQLGMDMLEILQESFALFKHERMK
jgi:hypothetical protein